MNILVVDNCEYPHIYGYMQNLFGRFLPERGHNVTWLLLSDISTNGGEIGHIASTEAVLSPILKKRGKFASLVNYFYYKPRLSRLLPGVIESREIDIVFVRNHVRIGVSARRICKKLNVPLVFYLGYPTLESHRLSARLGYRRPRFLAELAALVGIPLRNYLCRNVDFLYTMSDYWKQQVVTDIGVSADKVDSLPAGFDPTIVLSKLDGDMIRKRYHLGEHPTVFYMGTISPPRDASILVDILAEVAKSIPQVRLLLLYGQGEEKWVPFLKNKFKAKGVAENVIFAPPVPYSEIADHLAAVDVGLSPIETIPLYNVSSPYKFTEMLGMGCPVVASNTPDQAYVLKSSGGGICVPYDAKAFAGAVIQILSNPNDAKEMGKRARDFVGKRRGYDVLSAKLEKRFSELINTNNQ